MIKHHRHHQHRAKQAKLYPISVFLAGAAVTLLYAMSFSFPAIVVGAFFTCVLTEFIKRGFERAICLRVSEFENTKQTALRPDELASFNLGVLAANSPTQLLFSWAKPITYPYFKAFILGKHLAEHGNEGQIARIKEKARKV